MQNNDQKKRVTPFSNLSVCLFAKYSALTEKLCNRLVAKNISITVVTAKPNEWKKYNSQEVSSNLKIYSHNDEISDGESQYSIFFTSDVLRYETYNQHEIPELQKFFSLSPSSKKLVILPYLQQRETYVKRQEYLLPFISPRTGLIYAAYPRFSEEQNFPIAGFVSRADHIDLLGVDGQSFIEHIERLIFSFRAYNQTVAIIGDTPQVVSSDIPSHIIATTDVITPKVVDEVITIPSGTFDWGSFIPEKNVSISPTLAIPKLKLSKPTKRKGHFRTPVFTKRNTFSRFHIRIPKFRVFALSLLIIAIFGFPAVLSIYAHTQLPRGFETLKTFQYKKATGRFHLVEEIAGFGSTYARGLSSIPGLESVYAELSKKLTTIKNIAALGQSASQSLLLSGNLFKSVANGEGDSKKISNELALALSTLYKEAQFLEGELTNTDSNLLKSLKEDNPVLTILIENALDLQQFVTLLPTYIGTEKPSNVAVLFQDPLFNSASGGRISRVALVSFSGGKITSILLFSPQDIDRQSKGMMEAPSALQKLVNSPTWKFQDANWQADFSEASKDVARFMEHTLAISVNGVVALPISEGSTAVLGTTTESRGITETLSQGSVILDTLNSMTDTQKNEAVVTTLTSLHKREVSVVLPGEHMKQVLSRLRWNGALETYSCSFSNCYIDSLSIIETNASFVPSRELAKEAELEVRIEEGSVKRNLTLNLQNNATSLYRGYLRAIVPGNSGIGKVTIIQKGIQKTLIPVISAVGEMKDVGIEVSLPAKEKVTLILSWESSFPIDSEKTPGKYTHAWFKQIGDSNLQVKTTIYVPKQKKVTPERLLLTEDGLFSYNTALTEDYTSALHW